MLFRGPDRDISVLLDTAQISDSLNPQVSQKIKVALNVDICVGTFTP